MNISMKMSEDNILTIYLKGSVTADNAGKAEEEIMNIYNENPAEKVILDAQELTYISSSGLRILLKLCRAEKNLSMVNVSRDVYEILEMTGFSEMIDIKKGLREISLEDCEVIGKGGHGQVLRLNDDTIVKLFHPGTPLEDAIREQEYAKKAFIMGVPTAIPFDVVKCGDSIGLVFEMVNSDTLAEVMKKNPDRFEEYALKYAKLLKQLHSTKVSKDLLSGTKELYRERIERIRSFGYFTEQEVQDLHRINDAFADDTAIIHGDFHPKNVMVMNDELVLIDMADITYGNPLYDLGSMLLTHVTVSPERKEAITGLPVEMVDRLWKIFISVYLETADPKVIEITMKKSGVFAMLKAAAALGFSPTANTEFIVTNVTAMARKNLLSNVDGCIALLSM